MAKAATSGPVDVMPRRGQEVKGDAQPHLERGSGPPHGALISRGQRDAARVVSRKGEGCGLGV